MSSNSKQAFGHYRNSAARPEPDYDSDDAQFDIVYGPRWRRSLNPTPETRPPFDTACKDISKAGVNPWGLPISHRKIVEYPNSPRRYNPPTVAEEDEDEDEDGIQVEWDAHKYAKETTPLSDPEPLHRADNDDLRGIEVRLEAMDLATKAEIARLELLLENAWQEGKLHEAAGLRYQLAQRKRNAVSDHQLAQEPSYWPRPAASDDHDQPSLGGLQPPQYRKYLHQLAEETDRSKEGLDAARGYRTQEFKPKHIRKREKRELRKQLEATKALGTSKISERRGTIDFRCSMGTDKPDNVEEFTIEPPHTSGIMHLVPVRQCCKCTAICVAGSVVEVPQRCINCSHDMCGNCIASLGQWVLKVKLDAQGKVT